MEVIVFLIVIGCCTLLIVLGYMESKKKKKYPYLIELSYRNGTCDVIHVESFEQAKIYTKKIITDNKNQKYFFIRKDTTSKVEMEFQEAYIFGEEGSLCTLHIIKK